LACEKVRKIQKETIAKLEVVLHPSHLNKTLQITIPLRRKVVVDETIK
jgi:hypothetical protein